MKKRLSIVGLGWFGMELASVLKDDYHVFGTKRKVPTEPCQVEVMPLHFDPEPEGAPLSKVFDAELLVLNIPPNARSENAEHNYRRMMDSVIAALERSPIKRAIFISSTGVFGKNEGKVDEYTLPIPTTTSGRILIEAEQRFLSVSSSETFVLRPAGLVGGDRHPAKFLAGREGISGRLNPVNLVHRNDLIAITASLLEADKLSGRVFHAASSGHPSKEEYYSVVTRKLGLAVPSFDQSDHSLGKEVDAERSKVETGVKFMFEDPFSMS